jgi:hypothetical protein
MTDERSEYERTRAGLCASCTHAHLVVSSRGSTFYLCRLADHDPAFRRYPVLPVTSCRGFMSEASTR